MVLGMTLSRHDEMAGARAAALRALSSRPYTTAQITTKLQGRYDDEAVRAVVAELTERGLLDDAAFAKAWRDSREHARPRSARLVRRELEQRGVARTVAEAAVEGMDDDATADRAARTQLRRMAGLDRETFHRRLGGYLLRRGYSEAVAYRTVRKLSTEMSWARGAE
jgi:regulatory protein